RPRRPGEAMKQRQVAIPKTATPPVTNWPHKQPQVTAALKLAVYLEKESSTGQPNLYNNACITSKN
ncbi:hypothetical protein OB13_17115, partial [Pontibacter sp. HJ8]